MLIPVWAFYGGYDYGDGIKTPDGTIFWKVSILNPIAF